MSETARATRLSFEDQRLGKICFPKRPLHIRRGLGSGLALGADGRLFAVGDRGPNLKVKLAAERYGLDHLRDVAGGEKAKVMPALEVGPAIVELSLEGDRVSIVAVLPLRDGSGAAVSGLPTPGSANCVLEPALAPDGRRLAADPAGIDSEGLAVTRDGAFWVGDEYGPSLLRICAGGTIERRLVPEGCGVDGAPFPVEPVLPRIAAKRHVNRGFEAIALSGDEQKLHLASQSPLAFPDPETHERACHCRLWTVDLASGAAVAQYLYPLDPPESFRRDAAEGKVRRSDVKVSEMVALSDSRLLVLERISHTTKLYVVELTAAAALAPEELEMERRPSIEERSAAGKLDLPVLEKRLVLTTDELPQVCKDMEGMVVLGGRTLLLVNDNDFGIEDAETEFWRIQLAQPL
jgi:hypothetical protein